MCGYSEVACGVMAAVQIAKENKKFIYGLVREGGRAKEYETAKNPQMA